MKNRYTKQSYIFKKRSRVKAVAYIYSYPGLFIFTLTLSLCVFIPKTSANYSFDVQVAYETSNSVNPYHLPSTSTVLLAEKEKKDLKKRWEQLNVEEKKRIKQQVKRFEELPPEQKKRIKKARERFRNMSPDEQKALREKWRKMTPQERRNSLKK